MMQNRSADLVDDRSAAITRSQEGRREGDRRASSGMLLPAPVRRLQVGARAAEVVGTRAPGVEMAAAGAQVGW